MIEKRNVRQIYNLPEEIKFCKKCTISNQRPRIVFDEDGICSACSFSEIKKHKIDWQEREKELQELCNRHRKSDGRYDVIVPCSGGKDGGVVAHQLKYKYNMNPLCVTWAPLLPTDIGRKNLDSFLQAGFNHILGTANPVITRKLTKLAFIYMGEPFQPFIYGQTNFPIKIAVQNNVSLIMYGENGEVEYGGDMKNAFSPTREIVDHDEHYFSGKPPEFWSSHGITRSDLQPFMRPTLQETKENKTEIHFFGYYHYWDPQDNYYYCKQNTGFRPNYQRTKGTYSKYASIDDKIDGLHYYLGYIKFGIGRTTSDTAHEIRDGRITRDEGISLVKRYDGEFPSIYFNEFLDYCDISEEQFREVVDSWRSPHIWYCKQGQWRLKRAIYDNASLTSEQKPVLINSAQNL